MNLPSELDLQKIISRYEKIGFRRRDRANSSQEKEMFLDLSNVWKAKKKSPCQQYQAIRESTMFSDYRKMTFVKFNYRNTEINNISYNEAFKKVVQRDKKYLNKSYLRKQYSKGTMNITELWSERSMQQVLGSMPYPRDRLKILKLYQQDKHNLISSQGIGYT